MDSTARLLLYGARRLINIAMPVVQLGPNWDELPQVGTGTGVLVAPLGAGCRLTCPAHHLLIVQLPPPLCLAAGSPCPLLRCCRRW